MPLNADTPTSPRTSVFAMTVASALLLGLAVGGFWSMGQVALAPSTVPAYLAVDGTSTSPLSSNTHTQQLRTSTAGPAWREITAAQREVLHPLQERWDSMGGLTKRRWLVLADRYPQMNEAERAKLLARMKTWASLSAQQRTQARLNFETTKRLSAQELQTKWDEYQALSDAEKQRLAEQARKSKTAKKAKRRLALPKQRVNGTPGMPPPPVMVQTQPVHTPQAAPAVALPPTDLPQPVYVAPPEVSSRPVAVPQSMPSVDLPPLLSAPLPDSTPATEAAQTASPSPAAVTDTAPETTHSTPTPAPASP